MIFDLLGDPRTDHPTVPRWLVWFVWSLRTLFVIAFAVGFVLVGLYIGWSAFVWLVHVAMRQ